MEISLLKRRQTKFISLISKSAVKLIRKFNSTMYVGVASLEADDTRLKVEKEENYAIPRAGN